MPKLTSRTLAWRDGGEGVAIAGHDIFVHERAGRRDLPFLVFLHGYPSRPYDWRHGLQRLSERQLIMFDFLGFGLSAKPREDVYSLLTQADIVETIAARFAAKQVMLVAHDIGSSVATELLARDLEGRLSFELRPHAPVTRLRGLGHYPQLEDPHDPSKRSSDWRPPHDQRPRQEVEVTCFDRRASS